jgi:putative ABC transport system permease protein
MIISIAWRQLFKQRSRLLAAIAGIVFAVVLIMVQLGFQAALYESATLHYDHMKADIILLSPQYEAIMYNNSGFPAQRLNQAYAVDGVASTLAVYGSFVAWKNPWTHMERTMYMFGFNPVPGFFDLGAIKDPGPLLRMGDSVLFDDRSRKEYGDVPSAFLAGKRVVTEMVGHRVEVTGLFSAGTSFGIDGAVIMSDANFFRLMPGRSPEVVNFGLIKVKPGFDPDRVRAQLAKTLPPDVRVLTHSQLDQAEREFWSSNTPIGFIFALGVGLGLVVGIIIVYQILYTDVTDHLQEYATLKAIGYKDSFLFAIIIYESLILSIFGYIPGFFISLFVYRIATDATFLPLRMNAERGVLVYLLTIAMCVLSGALALRRLRQADPAEIF